MPPGSPSLNPAERPCNPRAKLERANMPMQNNSLRNRPRGAPTPRHQIVRYITEYTHNRHYMYCKNTTTQPSLYITCKTNFYYIILVTSRLEWTTPALFIPSITSL